VVTIDVPGFGHVQAKHLVLDYNGTLACDGRLIDGVRDRLDWLSHVMTLHVITGDH